MAPTKIRAKRGGKPAEKITPSELIAPADEKTNKPKKAEKSAKVKVIITADVMAKPAKRVTRAATGEDSRKAKEKAQTGRRGRQKSATESAKSVIATVGHNARSKRGKSASTVPESTQNRRKQLKVSIAENKAQQERDETKKVAKGRRAAKKTTEEQCDDKKEQKRAANRVQRGNVDEHKQDETMKDITAKRKDKVATKVLPIKTKKETKTRATRLASKTAADQKREVAKTTATIKRRTRNKAKEVPMDMAAEEKGSATRAQPKKVVENNATVDPKRRKKADAKPSRVATQGKAGAVTRKRCVLQTSERVQEPATTDVKGDVKKSSTKTSVRRERRKRRGTPQRSPQSNISEPKKKKTKVTFAPSKWTERTNGEAEDDGETGANKRHKGAKSASETIEQHRATGAVIGERNMRGNGRESAVTTPAAPQPTEEDSGNLEHDVVDEEEFRYREHDVDAEEPQDIALHCVMAEESKAEVAAVAEMGVKGSGCESAVITPVVPQPVEEDSGDLKCGVVAEEFRFREHDVDVGEPQDTALHCVMAEEPKIANAEVAESERKAEMRSGSVGAEQETKHDGDQFGRLVKASEVHDLSSEEKLFGKSHWLGGKDDVVASSSTTEARQTSATPPKEQAEVAAVAEMGMKGSGSESAVITPAAPQPVEEDSGDLKCGVVAEEEFRYREHDVDAEEPQDIALHCVMAEESKAEVAAVAEMGVKGSGCESAVITPVVPQPVEEDSGDLKCGVVAEEFRFREHDVDVGEPQDTALHCVMAEEPKRASAEVMESQRRAGMRSKSVGAEQERKYDRDRPGYLVKAAEVHDLSSVEMFVKARSVNDKDEVLASPFAAEARQTSCTSGEGQDQDRGDGTDGSGHEGKLDEFYGRNVEEVIVSHAGQECRESVGDCVDDKSFSWERPCGTGAKELSLSDLGGIDDHEIALEKHSGFSLHLDLSYGDGVKQLSAAVPVQYDRGSAVDAFSESFASNQARGCGAKRMSTADLQSTESRTPTGVADTSLVLTESFLSSCCPESRHGDDVSPKRVSNASTEMHISKSSQEIVRSCQEVAVFAAGVSKDDMSFKAEVSNNEVSEQVMEFSDEEMLEVAKGGAENMEIRKGDRVIEQPVEEDANVPPAMKFEQTAQESPKQSLPENYQEKEKLVADTAGAIEVAKTAKHSAVPKPIQSRFEALHRKFWERAPSIQEHMEHVKQRYLKHQAEVTDTFHRLSKCKQTTSESSVQLTAEKAARRFDMAKSPAAGPSSLSLSFRKHCTSQLSKEKDTAAYSGVSSLAINPRSRFPEKKVDVKTFTKQRDREEEMHGPRVFARSRSEPRLSKKIERFTTPKGPKSHLCMAVTDRKDKAGAEDIPRYGPHKYIPAFVDTMHMSDTQYFDAVKKGLVHPVTAFRMDGKVTSTTQKKP